MIRSFMNQQLANPGFRPAKLLTARSAPSPARYASPEAVRRLQQTLLSRMAALPEVEAVATVNVLPLSGEGPRWPFEIEGRVIEPENRPEANARIISPRYLDVMGIALLRGRSIAESDRENTVPVALVSAALARQFFPGENAVGKRIKLPTEEMPREIIGVVGDVSDWRLGVNAMGSIYVPHRQRPRGELALTVRTRGEPQAAAARSNDVVRLMLLQGLRPVGVGFALGLAGAVASAGALRGLLFELSPLDPVTLLSVGALLALVSFAATAVPALRALRIAPMTALRNH